MNKPLFSKQILVTCTLLTIALASQAARAEVYEKSYQPHKDRFILSAGWPPAEIAKQQTKLAMTGNEVAVTPQQVADEFVQGIESDTFDIRVGFTADFWKAYLNSPNEAFEMLNSRR